MKIHQTAMKGKSSREWLAGGSWEESTRQEHVYLDWHGRKGDIRFSTGVKAKRKMESLAKRCRRMTILRMYFPPKKEKNHAGTQRKAWQKQGKNQSPTPQPFPFRPGRPWLEHLKTPLWATRRIHGDDKRDQWLPGVHGKEGCRGGAQGMYRKVKLLHVTLWWWIHVTPLCWDS